MSHFTSRGRVEGRWSAYMLVGIPMGFPSQGAGRLCGRVPTLLRGGFGWLVSQLTEPKISPVRQKQRKCRRKAFMNGNYKKVV